MSALEIAVPTEDALKAMSFDRFEQWILARKKEFAARYDRSSKNNESIAQSLLNRYEKWQDWFAGEITGYDSTVSKNKPCRIEFFATDDREYSLNKAIAYAKAAYIERTERLTARLAEEAKEAAIAH